MSENQQPGGPVAQYRVYFKPTDAGPKDQFKLAEPGVHRPLFQREVVVSALSVIRAWPMLEAVTVRDDLGLYNIVTFAKTTLDPFAELLHPPETPE